MIEYVSVDQERGKQDVSMLQSVSLTGVLLTDVIKVIHLWIVAFILHQFDAVTCHRLFSLR